MTNYWSPKIRAPECPLFFFSKNAIYIPLIFFLLKISKIDENVFEKFEECFPILVSCAKESDPYGSRYLRMDRVELVKDCL